MIPDDHSAGSDYYQEMEPAEYEVNLDDDEEESSDDSSLTDEIEQEENSDFIPMIY